MTPDGPAEAAGWLRSRYAQPEAILAAYRAVWGIGPGQTVLADLEAVARMHGSAFVPGDPHATAFRLGQQSLILHVRQVLAITSLNPKESTA